MKPRQALCFVTVSLVIAVTSGCSEADGDNTNEPGSNLPDTAFQISAGGTHTCALTDAGTVMCWGVNEWGEAGNPTGDILYTPSTVNGFGGAVLAISSGGYHTCALTEDHAVGCWGQNSDGQLGNGTMNVPGKKYSVPDRVVGLPSAITAVSSGSFHTCALTNSGAVYCWGGNTGGQLGNGQSGFESSSPIPVLVTGLDSGVIAISAGYGNTCVLTDARQIKCWGDGTGDYQSGANVPKLVPGVGPDVVSVASGSNTTCVLTSGGAVKCMGDLAFFEREDGEIDIATVPTQIKGLDKDVVGISVGNQGACAIIAGGRVLCWGKKGDWYNCAGESIDASIAARLFEPTEVVGLESGVTAVTLGQDHGCAMLESGKAMCWGANNTGKVGDGTSICRPDPVEVVGFP